MRHKTRATRGSTPAPLIELPPGMREQGGGGGGEGGGGGRGGDGGGGGGGRGGEVISDPKNYVADFSVPNEHFSLLNFRKKGGGVSLTPIRKIQLQIFVSRGEKSAT